MEQIGDLGIFGLECSILRYQINILSDCLLSLLVIKPSQLDDSIRLLLPDFACQVHIRTLICHQSPHLLANVDQKVINTAKFVQLQQQTEDYTLPVLLVELYEIFLFFAEVCHLVVDETFEEDLDKFYIEDLFGLVLQVQAVAK